MEKPTDLGPGWGIGVEGICVESNYPRGGSTWLDTQKVIHEACCHLPPDELGARCSGNPAALYRHPLPNEVLPR